MPDRDVVAAIVAGDPAGLAAAYDAYAASLHAYCRTLLGEPADAADAVQDTFVIAAAKLGGLRDPDRLRPWLYAVARNECHRRLRGRAKQADLDEAGEVTDAGADVGEQAERGDLRRLVLAAIGGLNPGDREVIELNLRHDLDGADLAGALGVPVNQAHALASRARGQLERSLGALLVARNGREQCAELDALLAGWDGQLTPLLRKRVSRHIEHCEICGERKRRELSPAALLSVLPLAVLPPDLRQQVLHLVSDSRPETIGYRASVVRRSEPYAESGFPVPLDPVAQPPAGHPVRNVALIAAVALLILGGSLTLLLLGGRGHDTALHRPDPASPVVKRSSPSASGAVTSPAGSASGPATAPAGSSSSSPSPSASLTLPLLSTSPPPGQSTSPVPSPSSSSPSPSPPPGTLSESPSTVRLPDAGSSATFTLTASGGPVSYSVTDTAGSYLIVSPASGTVPDGQTVTITVQANPNNPPPYVNTLTVSPGGLSVTVYYEPSG
ncbi:MAG TPA: sigma-70 family RNA polymerase sigma factor [Streptosporangiaceae bacterium]|nr:sigma-70 family RNA polymerase sigma factor [Streptosporangiaceae bacterium]